EVPHDPHGHEEACWRLGAGWTRHHAEGRTSANLQARPAQAGEGGGVDREGPSALGHTLRRAGYGCRRTETKGEDRWAQAARVRLVPRRAERLWNGSPIVRSLSRELSTRRRDWCLRRGPGPSCSSGGGCPSRWI